MLPRAQIAKNLIEKLEQLIVYQKKFLINTPEYLKTPELKPFFLASRDNAKPKINEYRRIQAIVTSMSDSGDFLSADKETLQAFADRSKRIDDKPSQTAAMIYDLLNDTTKTLEDIKVQTEASASATSITQSQANINCSAPEASSKPYSPYFKAKSLAVVGTTIAAAGLALGMAVYHKMSADRP